MTDLSSKVALITGASRGIGAAIAHKLAACGATVVLAARTRGGIEANAAAIAEAGGTAHAHTCDVARYENVENVVGFCKEQLGRLDILINNAGVIEPIGKITETDPDAWGHSVDINYKGVYYGLRAAIPVMRAQGSGTIVNISSGAATSPLEGWSQYCSAKAAAKMLTECAHKEFGETGIRVIGLSPGTVATDMMAQIKASGVNPVSALDWSVHIPPEWVAEAAAFLCGPEGGEFAGTDFSLKTEEGRRRVGLSLDRLPT